MGKQGFTYSPRDMLRHLARHFRRRVKGVTTVERFNDTLYESKGISRTSLSIARNMACLAVSQFYVDQVLKDMESDDGPGSVEYGFLMLVSIHDDEEPRHVPLSMVFPRVYNVLGSLGWDMFRGDDLYDG